MTFSKHDEEQRAKWPLPGDVEFIFCQAEACVIGKCRTAGCNK
jgi:hypothetical protein